MKGGPTPLFDRICRRCGLSWGAHRNGDGLCPGHEGRMDWDAGPGTRFEYAGYEAIVRYDTAAQGSDLPPGEER